MCPLPLSLIQLINWICKSRPPESSAPVHSAQKMWLKLLISFIFLPSLSSELLFSLHSHWLQREKEFPVACKRLRLLGRRHVSPSTVLLLSFSLRRRRTHSEDSRKQILELCVLPQVSELLPGRVSGCQARRLQGKRGQAHAHLRGTSSLSKPRKQQNLFSLH